jgi:hypothetical protein
MMWSRMPSLALVEKKPPLTPPKEGDYRSGGVRNKIVFEIR